MDFSPLTLSLKTAGLATLLAAVAGIASARWLAAWPRRRRLCGEILILIPLVLPPTVIGYGLLYLIGRQGPIGWLIAEGGGEGLIFTWWAGAIAAAVVCYPIMYISAKAAFEQVDRHLLDAALVFGAGPWRRFCDVLVPLARPGLLAGLLMSLARALGEFGASLMVAGHIPGRTETIPMRIFFAVEAGENGWALFWSCVALSLATLVLACIQIFGPSARREEPRSVREGTQRL